MTDRTPASPVEVLDLARLQRRIEDHDRRYWSSDHDWRHIVGHDCYECCARDRGELRAALQAQDHTITKGGLDEFREWAELQPGIVYRADILDAVDRIRGRAALEPTHD